MNGEEKENVYGVEKDRRRGCKEGADVPRHQ